MPSSSISSYHLRALLHDERRITIHVRQSTSLDAELSSSNRKPRPDSSLSSSADAIGGLPGLKLRFKRSHRIQTNVKSLPSSTNNCTHDHGFHWSSCWLLVCYATGWRVSMDWHSSTFAHIEPFLVLCVQLVSEIVSVQNHTDLCIGLICAI